jgi:hypothetical protein
MTSAVFTKTSEGYQQQTQLQFKSRPNGLSSSCYVLSLFNDVSWAENFGAFFVSPNGWMEDKFWPMCKKAVVTAFSTLLFQNFTEGPRTEARTLDHLSVVVTIKPGTTSVSPILHCTACGLVLCCYIRVWEKGLRGRDGGGGFHCACN